MGNQVVPTYSTISLPWDGMSLGPELFEVSLSDILGTYQTSATENGYIFGFLYWRSKFIFL